MTAVAPVKPLPLIVTRSPPAARHWFGWTPLTVGSLAWSPERTPNRTVGMCSPARRLGPAFVVTNASRIAAGGVEARRVGRRRGDLALAVHGEACRDLLRIGAEGDGGHVGEAGADDRHARSALGGASVRTDTAHGRRRAGIRRGGRRLTEPHHRDVIPGAAARASGVGDEDLEVAAGGVEARRVGRRRSDLRVAVDLEFRRDLLSVRAEGDGGRAGEAGAGDGHLRAAVGGALSGLTPLTVAGTPRSGSWAAGVSPNLNHGIVVAARRFGPAGRGDDRPRGRSSE